MSQTLSMILIYMLSMEMVQLFSLMIIYQLDHKPTFLSLMKTL